MTESTISFPEHTCHALIVLCTRKGNIHVESKPRPRANLLRASRSGEEGPVVIAMKGDVQDAWVVVEYVLCPIPMMDVLWNGMGGHPFSTSAHVVMVVKSAQTMHVEKIVNHTCIYNVNVHQKVMNFSWNRT